jgi:hypothetical protein
MFNYPIVRKYTITLSRSHPKCLSTTKTVKGKCDGILSFGEVCDEHGTSSNCCTSDCKLKPGAICSPVSLNLKDGKEIKKINVLFFC